LSSRRRYEIRTGDQVGQAKGSTAAPGAFVGEGIGGTGRMAEMGWCKTTGPQGFYPRRVAEAQVADLGSVTGSTAGVRPAAGPHGSVDDRY
jgi:hypothetical protein